MPFEDHSNSHQRIKGFCTLCDRPFRPTSKLCVIYSEMWADDYIDEPFLYQYQVICKKCFNDVLKFQPEVKEVDEDEYFSAYVLK
jgi:hypothetical protein